MASSTMGAMGAIMVGAGIELPDVTGRREEPGSGVRPRLPARSEVERRSNHDIHFLERLDRVADHHVELALTLYRDEELLREVLNRAALPDSVERLAISLDDEREGPFVIVTRTGRFVTCLGAGMHVDRAKMPVLSRARLDAAASKVERMRERLADAASIHRAGGDSSVARIFRRMLADWRRVSREDASLLIRFQPFIRGMCMQLMVETHAGLMHMVDHVACLRFDRLRSHEEELVMAFDRSAWLASHFSVITDPEIVERTMEIVDEQTDGAGPDLSWTFNSFMFGMGTHAHATRALWAVGQRGRRALPHAKQRVVMPLPQALFRELSLGAIALSSSKSRAEAEKAHASASQRPTQVEPEDQPAVDAIHQAAVDIARHVIDVVDAPAAPQARSLEAGRQSLAMFLRHADVPQDAPISDASARAFLANDGTSWMSMSNRDLRRMLDTLPNLGDMSAEDLFLPAEQLRALPPPTLELALAMIQPSMEWTLPVRPRVPVRAGARIGRNDPCTCGSGKKYKRCCGAH